MPAQYVNYRSFNDKAMALALFDQLKAAGFDVQWEDTEGFFDVSFANNEFMNLYYVKLHPGDFEAADALLAQQVAQEHETPTEDYYLYDFTDDELRDVLVKRDEWNEFDRYWAEKILKDRGVEIAPEVTASAQQQHLAELERPWKLDKFWLTGILATVIICAFLLHIALLGALTCLGAIIAYTKKTLVDGRRVFAFSKPDRLIGRIIMIVTILAMAVIMVMLYLLSKRA